MEINSCIGPDNVTTKEFFSNNWAALCVEQVTRWHLNAEAWVQIHTNTCGVCGGQSGTFF
jgi:hypothetical protein